MDVDTFRGRWADQDGGIALCGSIAGLTQALADNERDIEIELDNGAEMEGIIGMVIAKLSGDNPIKRLSITSNGLTDELLAKLSHHLDGLTALGVSRQPSISAATWDLVFQRLPSSLEKIDFGDNKLDNFDFLFREIPRLVNLKQLFLDGNAISQVRGIADSMATSQLEELDLGDNKIGKEAVKDLAEAIPKNKNLKLLVIGSNPIDCEDAGVIFEALCDSEVETLYLDHTQIRDDGLRRIAKFIGRTNLIEFHMDNNQIGDAGFADLIPALPGTEIEYLDVSETFITPEMQKAIELAIGADQYCQEEEDPESENCGNCHESCAPTCGRSR